MSDQWSHRHESGEPPAEGPAPVVHANAAARQTDQLVRALQEAIRDSIRELRDDVKSLENRVHGDYHRLLYIFGAGFVAIVALFGWGYTQLEDRFTTVTDRQNTRLESMSTLLTKVDTKLEDLLARIPPIPTPPRR